jgi:transposase-like protein
MTEIKDYPIVHMPCRRGQDRVTHGSKCDCKRAYNLSAAGARHASFRCVDCKYEWTVPVGGSFNIF